MVEIWLRCRLCCSRFGSATRTADNLVRTEWRPILQADADKSHAGPDKKCRDANRSAGHCPDLPQKRIHGYRFRGPARIDALQEYSMRWDVAPVWRRGFPPNSQPSRPIGSNEEFSGELPPPWHSALRPRRRAVLW